MTAHLIPRPWLAVLIVLAMAVALAACSGDSESETPETPEPAPAAATAAADEPEAAAPDEDEPVEAAEADEPAAAAQADEPEPEPAPAEADEPAPADDPDGRAAAQSEPSGEAPEISVNAGTTWQELFDAFTPDEQSCIRDTLGGDFLAAALSERVLAGSASDPWQADLLSCLPGPTAEAVFFAVTVAGVEQNTGPLGADERTCLRALVAGSDVVEVAAASADDAASVDFSAGMLDCLSDVMLRYLIEGSGVAYDDLSEEERSCLRELLIGDDGSGFLTAEASDDPAAFGALLEGLFSCIPDAALRAVLEDSGVAYDDLSEEEKACLLELVTGDELSALFSGDADEDPEAAFAFLGELFACVPGGLLLDGDFAGGEAPGDDDHADWPEEATAAAVGVSVEGVLEHGGDIDMFVFEAQEGAFYRIDAGLGTLDDSILRLLDSDWSELAYNDDYADTLASRIEWEAPAAGDYYVAVEGWGGAGSYTLTVTAMANVDDHGDQLPPEADATSASVGGSVEGELHHAADVDVFVFEAEEGVLYRIDVGLETLADSELTLYDAGGSVLDYNDDHGDSTASRIEWQAPAAGDYYLAVQGWGGETGAYSLTITVVAED